MGDHPPRGLTALLLLTAVILSAAVLGSSTEHHDPQPRATRRPQHAAIVCRYVDPGTAITTPDLVGMDVVSAMKRACDLGLRVEWETEPKFLDVVVRSQAPKPGAPIRTGDSVRLSAQ